MLLFKFLSDKNHFGRFQLLTEMNVLTRTENVSQMAKHTRPMVRTPAKPVAAWRASLVRVATNTVPLPLVSDTR